MSESEEEIATVGDEDTDDEVITPAPKRRRGRPGSKGKNAPGKTLRKKGTKSNFQRLAGPVTRSGSVLDQAGGDSGNDAAHYDGGGSSRSGVTTGNDLDTASQFGLLLSAITASKKEVNDQLALFRKEIKINSDEVTEKLAKKMKTSKTLEFKRKGNEKQYHFNSEVDEKLDVIENELSKPAWLSPPSMVKSPLRKIKEAVEEGRKIIANHQKLVLLADRSTHGWDVVKLYEVDELAEGSGDERKIRKAEKAAEKEVERRAVARRKNFKGGRRPTPFARDGAGAHIRLPGLSHVPHMRLIIPNRMERAGVPDRQGQ